MALVAGCTPPGPRALLEGKRLIDQGKYPQAVEQLREATALLTNNAQAWNYLGLAYHYSGQAKPAEQAYQRALNLNHDLSEAHYNLGCLWLEENRFEAAKSELIAYTLRRGNSVDPLLKLGTAQLYCREPAAAEKSFSEVLRLSPQNTAALNGLGLARLQRNRPGDAAEYFKGALRQQPDYRPAMINLAIVAQQYLRDRQLALQTYRAYLALKPPPPDSEAVSAVARGLEPEPAPPPRLVSSNAPPQASTNVNVQRPTLTNPPALASAPKPPPSTNLPRSLPVTDYVKPPIAPPPVHAVTAPSTAKVEVVTLPAEPVIKPAQDLPPPPTGGEAPAPEVTVTGTNTSAPLKLAETKTAKRGLLQRMNPLNLFRSEEKKDRTSTPLPGPSAAPPPAATNGVAVTNAEQTVKPLPPPKPLPRYTYLSPTKPAPGNRAAAQVEFTRGLEAQRAHNLTEAIQAYRAAIQSDPSFFEAYYDLGLAESDAGQSSVALATYETALAIRPDSVDGRYNFALALKQANYPVDAANEMEKVLGAQPNDVRAHLMLGLVYAQQIHNLDKARQHYLKVLELDPQNPQASAIRYWLATNQ